MSSEDDEIIWQDECFKALRICVAVIVEYTALIRDMDSPVGWTLVDLRSTTHDLLQAIEDSDELSAESLITEARVLLADLLRLLE